MNREDLNKNTPLHIVVQYLEKNIDDKIPMKKIEDFELGKLVGKVEILELLRNISK